MSNNTMSRRSALKAGLTMLAGTAAAARAEEPYVQPKIDRELVHYQYEPGPQGHHCSICSNFIDPNHCKVVDGIIAPDGYCLAFAPQDVPIP